MYVKPLKNIKLYKILRADSSVRGYGCTYCGVTESSGRDVGMPTPFGLAQFLFDWVDYGVPWLLWLP